jgi:hypothetical protein
MTKRFYYSEAKQKVSLKYDHLINDDSFEYVGMVSENEFNLLLDILFFKYGDNDISLEQIEKCFGDFRTYIDKLKRK